MRVKRDLYMQQSTCGMYELKVHGYQRTHSGGSTELPVVVWREGGVCDVISWWTVKVECVVLGGGLHLSSR